MTENQRRQEVCDVIRCESAITIDIYYDYA